jgi:hypothetical protein
MCISKSKANRYFVTVNLPNIILFIRREDLQSTIEEGHADRKGQINRESVRVRSVVVFSYNESHVEMGG